MFFRGEEVVVGSELLLPIYPCHILMWMTLITGFMKNKNSKVFVWLSSFAFYGGVVCASIGILFNENYLANPDITDYGILKGLLSHSTMLLSALYLFVMKYVKIDFIENFKGIVLGLVFLIVDGLIVNSLFEVFRLPEVNAMYLLNPPYPDFPYINVFSIGIISIFLSFVILNIMELVMLKKEERFLYKLINKGKKQHE
jgi:hypothetical protein